MADEKDKYYDGEDELKEQSNTSLLDSIESAGGTALAIGAGAALFYRIGGRKMLSEGVNRFSRFLSNATREYAGQEMGRDYTIISATKRLFTDRDSIWKNTANELETEGLDIRSDNPNSLLGFLREFESSLQNSNRTARDIFNGEISVKVADEFSAKFNNSPDIAAKIQSYVLRLKGDISPHRAADLRQSIFTEEELNDIGQNEFDDILDRINKLSSDNNRYDQIKKNIEKSIPDVLKGALDDAEKTFGSNLDNKKTNAQIVKDAILGDRSVTVKEMIDNQDKFQAEFQKKGMKNDVAVDNAIDMLKRMRDRLETDTEKDRFDNLYVDNAIRINKNGEISSFSEAAKITDRVMDYAAGTIPGTLLKLRDLSYINKAPNFAIFEAGQGNPILSRIAEQSEDSILRKNYIYSLGKVYQIQDDGKLNHVKEFDNIRLQSGRYGTTSHMYKAMFGDKSMRQTGDSKTRKFFDFNINGDETIFEEFASRFKKFTDKDWRGNVVSDLLNDVNRVVLSKDEERFTRSVQKLNEFYNKNTYKLNKKSINALKDQTVKGTTEYNLLHHINGSDKELLDYLLGKGSNSLGGIDSLHNNELKSMLYDYLRDPAKAINRVNVKYDSVHYFSGKQADTFYDMLRIESTKEVFLKHAENNNTLNAITDLINNSSVNKKEKEQMRRMAHWGVLQYKTNITSQLDSNINATKDWQKEVVKQVDDILSQDSNNAHYDFNKDFRKTLDNLGKENIVSHEKHRQRRTSVVQEQYYSDYIISQKAVDPLDLIKAYNKGEFKKAGMKFINQFVAGRDNAKDVTSITMAPYFMAERLSESLNTIGLGLSNLSSQDALSLMGGLVLKRALPLYVGYTYLDYLNDSKRQITGSSFTTDFLSGTANIDLGVRSFMDSTGLGGVYNAEKKLNPFLQYAFGKEDYQDHDTREDYYKNGYTPVRAGRFWSFGSVNEFRGNRIQYWMPNALRQSTSNYKDNALYGSFDNKWSHSILPTPTHPFSTISAITDPYYMEKLHYNDRPYPLTGHMFEDGTIWGTILNPTVGAVLKPQIKMHQDRLNKDGVDVKRIIEQRNIAEMRKAAGNQYLVKWRNNEPELIDFTAFGAPTPSERVATAQIINGKVTNIKTPGYSDYEGGATPDEMEDIGELSQKLRTPVQMLNTQGFITGKGTDKTITGLDMYHKLVISSAKGNALAKVGKELIYGVHPVKQIGEINQAIIDKAKYDPSQGVMVPEPVHYTSSKAGTRQMQVLNDPEAMGDLLNANSGDKYAHELAIMGRNLAGIYGWMANNGVGIGNNNVQHLATAQDMTSISRGFWDNALGGLGGEASEIGRRFFQEFRRANIINPLKNTMPDWMPERFRYGDPYTVVPDGEARIPGRGYTSLNKLHPDQFGKYGAFDRFKILADIAPQSPEYRIWSQIASKTITDPNLRKEMKDIKKRRSEMAKQHDFYDYKFLGRGLDYKNVTIQKVIDNNHFTLIGDKTVYRLAGVRVLNDANGNQSLKKHLHAGQDVTIAVDENKFYRTNDDDQHTVNAAVFINGDNLAQEMIGLKEAKVRKGDTSAAGTIGQYGTFRRLEGKAWEFISHLDIPWYSDKFARIRSPLESYKAEQVYGTPYQTWSDPIGTFLMPAWERAISSGNSIIAGSMAWLFAHKVDEMEAPSKWLRYSANAAYMLSNRGAFIGSTLGYIFNGEMGKTSRKLADVGAAATFLGYTYTHQDNPLATGSVASTIGFYGAKLFGKDKYAGLALGAVVGGAYGLINKITEPANKKDWVPDRIKAKWDMQEYFDRLNYIKFAGLYRRTAELAKEKEGIDLDHMIELYSKSAEQKKMIKYQLEQAKKDAKKYLRPDDPDRKNIIHIVNQKLQNMQDSQMIMKAGPIAHMALVYRQTALSTMYGAKADASWMDLIRAVPKNERDYFLEFVKEKDPEKQKEILKTTSPYLSRALQMAWGQKVKKMENNTSYFKRHRLPGMKWSGWRPDTDLQNVEVKAIKNEGMLLGDFGFYESQLRDPRVINAPSIHPHSKRDSSSQIRAKIKSILEGQGLRDVDIQVKDSDDESTSTIFNCIKTSITGIGNSIINAFSF